LAKPSLGSYQEIIWLAFYNLINDKVSDPQNPDRSKWIYSSYPEKTLENKTDYPILVITPLEHSGSDVLTLSKSPITEYPIGIAIQIYSTSSREMKTIASDVVNVVMSNRTTLYGSGIDSLVLSNSVYNHYDLSGFKLHENEIRFTITYNDGDQ